MPILQFDTLDLVPEGLREYAKAVENGDGKVTINVVAASKIDEFRDNNIKLSQERDDLIKKLEPLQKIVGEDPEAFETSLTDLRATKQRVEDGELKEGRALEEALHKRTEEMRKSMEDRLQTEGKEKAAWRQKHDELERRYKQSQVASAVKDAAVSQDSGVVPEAINDITSRALNVFRTDDQGRIMAYAGDAPIYGADGVTPMTPKEWIAKLREEAPYFFKGSNGGGAGGDPNATKTVVGGHTREKLQAMTAAERLAAANGEAGSKL